MAQKAIIGGVAMKELSLFTGAGGGLLGTILLGWRCVGAVEWEDYPCRVLEARQKDGILDEFPIWHMDIREFNRRIAPSYTGLVDVITAGFPCQPFSVAGKRLGADDERNMWPATMECIRLVRPRYAFLENVPGLLTSGYFSRILGDLAESGYDCRWRILSAAELGAPHKRDRLWIVAHSNSERWATVENANRRVSGKVVPQEDGCTRQRGPWRTQSRRGNGGAVRLWPDTDVFGMVDEHSDWVDRLRAAGNAQVPAVVAAAWQLLTE